MTWIIRILALQYGFPGFILLYFVWRAFPKESKMDKNWKHRRPNMIDMEEMRLQGESI